MTRRELREGVIIKALSENEGHWDEGQEFIVRCDLGEYYIDCNDGSAHWLNENDDEASWLPDFAAV